MSLKTVWNELKERHRYAVCCVLSVLASLLGFVNPILSSFIAANIRNDFNLAGIIPSLVSMGAVKGTRMFLRSRVTNSLSGKMRAPYVWLQRRINKKLWWMEPMVGSWGWAGVVMTKLSGGKGISIQAAAMIASTVADTVDALASGIVYYFTQSYILSLFTALILPALAMAPWFAGKVAHTRRRSALHPR